MAKSHRAPSVTSIKTRRSIFGLALAGFGSSLMAAPATWTGTASTDFNAPGNWSGATGGGAPAATDNATFNTAPANLPNLNVSYGPIQGLTFSAGGWTLSKTGTSALSLSNTGTGTSSAINATNAAGTNSISADLVFTGTNTATITQVAGTLNLSGKLSLSGTDLSTVKTLTVNSTGPTNVSGVIQDYTGGAATLGGAGALFKTNTGVLSLSNANTYTGGTTIDRGTLNFTGTGSAASSAITLGTVGNPSGGNPLLTITPTASGTVTRGASLTVNGVIGSNVTRNITVTGISSPTTDQFTGDFTLHAGSANMLITSNNTANAVTRLNFGGTLVRNAGSVLNIYNSTSSGQVGGSGTSNTAKVTFGTGPTLTGAGTAGTSSMGILPYAVLVYTGGASFGTYDTNGLRKLDINTEMAQLTPTGFTAGQNARVASNTTTTLGGNVTVNSLFSGDSSGSNGALALAGNTITVTSGGVLSDAGNQSGTGATGFVIGSAQNDGVLNFGTAEGLLHASEGRLLVVNSSIQGSGGLTLYTSRIGIQSLIALNGANTFTGTTRMTGSGSSTIVGVRLLNGLALQNSTLDYGSNGGYFTFGSVNGTNNIVATDVTAATFGGLRGTQAIALTNAGNASGGVTLTLGSVGSADTVNTVNLYSGVLSGAGKIIKAGVATQVLSGANSYTGGTAINSGILQFARTNAMPNSNTVNVNNGGTLAVNVGGSGEFIATGSAAGSVGGLLIGIGGQSSSTVSFASGSSLGLDTTNSSGGAFTYAGSINNAGIGVTKLGTGTLNLTAGHAYGGPTRVRNGTLALTAAAGNTNIGSSSLILVGTNSTETAATLNVASVAGGFQVKSGQTLGGHGNVTGNSVQINSGATLAPGSSIGTLNITGATTLQGTSDFEINADTLTADRANITGTLTYGGTLKVTNLAGTLAANQTWNLFDFSSQSGFFANDAVFGTAGDGTNLPTLTGGKTWEFAYDTGILSITSSAPTISLSSDTNGTNLATGGSITVTGSNGSYASEMDELIAPGTATAGYAPVVTIGNETGTDYVMVWTDTNTVPAGLETGGGTLLTSGTLFSSLQGAYPGFDFIVAYSNLSGTKNVNFDFTGSGVMVDKLAVVPEPASIGLISLAGLMLGSRRRRRGN